MTEQEEAAQFPLVGQQIGGLISITIGMRTLCAGVSESEYANSLGENALKVIDPFKFAQAIFFELMAERPDGNCFLTNAFERAAKEAIEYGCDGVEVEGTK